MNQYIICFGFDVRLGEHDISWMPKIDGTTASLVLYMLLSMVEHSQARRGVVVTLSKYRCRSQPCAKTVYLARSSFQWHSTSTSASAIPSGFVLGGMRGSL